MKKYFYIFFFSTLFLFTQEELKSQLQYKIEIGSTTFTPLTNGTTLTWKQSGVDDNYTDSVQLPFPFEYLGENYDYIQVSTNGFLRFGGNLTSSQATNNLSGTVRRIVAPLWDDLKTTNLDQIKFQTSGNAPNRVFTVEWRSMFFPKNVLNANAEFQVKLHEDGKIEFIYGIIASSLGGSASIGLNDNTPIIVINNSSGTFFSINVAGAQGNRKFHQTMGQEFHRISESPDNGTLFTFTKETGSPLAGNFTIPGQEFSSISDFAMALNTRGVSGNVVASINEGVYDDVLHLLNIQGASNLNTITIKNGSGEVILSPRNASSDNNQGSNLSKGILRLEGSKFITIDGLKLIQNSTNQSVNSKFNCGIIFRQFYVSRGANNITVSASRFNTIKNVYINLSANSAPTIPTAIGIFFSNVSVANPDTSFSNSYNTIQDFVIEDFGQYGINETGYDADSVQNRENNFLGVNGRSEIKNNNLTTALELIGIRTLNVSNKLIENVDIYNLSSTLNTTQFIGGVYLASSAKQRLFDNNSFIFRKVNVWGLSKLNFANGNGNLIGIQVFNYSLNSKLLFDKCSISELLNNNSGAARTFGLSFFTSSVGQMDVVLQNNYVYNLRGPASNANTIGTGPGVCGINLQTGDQRSDVSFYLQNNTILLFETDSIQTGTYNSTALSYSGFLGGKLYSNNNVLVNQLKSSSGLKVAFMTTSFGDFRVFLDTTSNNNLYYSGNNSSDRAIAYNYSTIFRTLCDFRNYLQTLNPEDKRESNSVSENPPFIDIFGNIRLSTTIPTQADKGGKPVSNPFGPVSSDFYGNQRDLTNPDIGAEEFNGIYDDRTPPRIRHTPLLNSPSALQRLISAEITDLNGVDTGFNAPRVYFRKGKNGSFVFSSRDSVAGNEYFFKINHSLLQGGAIAGDTIYYYLAAQDKFTTNNGSTLPSQICGSLGSNPPGSIVPDTLFAYIITNLPLEGDYTVGLAAFNKAAGKNIQAVKKSKTVYMNIISEEEGEQTANNIKAVTSDYFEYFENGKPYLGSFSTEGVYANLTTALNDLNLRGINSSTRFLLTDTLYLEAGNNNGALLIDIDNEFVPAEGKTITIQPAANINTKVQVTSELSLLTIKELHTILNGSNSNSGIERNLRLINTGENNQSKLVKVFRANNVIVKNLIATGAALTVGNCIEVDESDMVTIENNLVNRAIGGIVVINRSTNCRILNNHAGGEIEEDKILTVGINVSNSNNFLIEGNTIAGIKRSIQTSAFGLSVVFNEIYSSPVTGRVSKNKITDVEMSGTGTSAYAAEGMTFQITDVNANILIDNNVITGLKATGQNFLPRNISGIRIIEGGSYKIINNSINLYGNMTFAPTSASYTKGIYLSSTLIRNVQILNNIISNTITWQNSTGNGRSVAIYSLIDTTGLKIVENNLFNTGNNDTLFAVIGTSEYSFTNYKNTFGFDQFSLLGNPAFTDSLNLKPVLTDPNSWNAQGRGMPYDFNDSDIENNPRSTSIELGPVDLGAYEFTPSAEPIPLSPSTPPSLGGSSGFLLGDANLAIVEWGNEGQVPDSVDLIYYPDEPEELEAVNYGFSRWVLRTYGGNNYNYNITLFYNPVTLGNLSDSLMKVAFNQGSGFSVKPTVINTALKTAKASGLTTGGKFALLQYVLDAPTNLMAMANQWRKIDINWGDNNDDELGFVLERKLGDSLSVTPYIEIAVLAPNTTSFLDTTSISDSTTYTYRIKAYNNFIESNWSNQAQVVSLIPVELNSFAASVDGKTIILNWTTGSERNNSGFEVQRKAGEEWVKLGFVDGMGSTAEKTDYAFTDKWDYQSFTGMVEYRLKQIDFDGTYEFSPVVSVDVDFRPTEYALYQNYPNPFNPSTVINYALPFESKVKLTVYNITGEVIKVLVDEVQAVGFQSVDFQANQLSSGLYIYVIDAKAVSGEKKYNAVKKMVLIK